LYIFLNVLLIHFEQITLNYKELEKMNSFQVQRISRAIWNAFLKKKNPPRKFLHVHVETTCISRIQDWTKLSRTSCQDQSNRSSMNCSPSELDTTICRIHYKCRACICHVDRQRWLTVYICVNCRWPRNDSCPILACISTLKSISSQMMYTMYPICMSGNEN